MKVFIEEAILPNVTLLCDKKKDKNSRFEELLKKWSRMKKKIFNNYLSEKRKSPQATPPLDEKDRGNVLCEGRCRRESYHRSNTFYSIDGE